MTGECPPAAKCNAVMHLVFGPLFRSSDTPRLRSITHVSKSPHPAVLCSVAIRYEECQLGLYRGLKF